MPSSENSVSPPRDRDGIKPRRIEGWATESLARLDASGSLHKSLTAASVLRRQATFLVLAFVDHEGLAVVAPQFRGCFGGQVEGDAAIIKDGLQQPAREFLQAALGNVPDGLLVALVMIGPKPMRHPKSYLKLIDLLNGRYGERKMQLVYQAEHIDGAIIDAFVGIDPDIPGPDPIETISSMQDVVRKKDEDQ